MLLPASITFLLQAVAYSLSAPGSVKKPSEPYCSSIAAVFTLKLLVAVFVFEKPETLRMGAAILTGSSLGKHGC